MKRLKEVSLVPAGANPLADVLVTKDDNSPLQRFMGALRRAFTAGADQATVEKALGDAETALAAQVSDDPEADGDGAAQGIHPLLAALGEVSDLIKGCGECKPGKPCKKHAKAYGDAMKAVIDKADEARSVSEILSRHKMWPLADALTQSIYEILDDESIKDKPKALDETFQQFKKSALETKGTPLTAEETMAENTTETAKDIPSHIQKQFDEMKTAQAAAEARAQAAETVAKEATDRVTVIEKDRERERAVVIVKEARGKLGGETDKLTDLYLKMDKEGRDALVADWKAASAQIDTAQLFKEVGKRGVVTPDSAEGKIEAKAAELQKADPKLTYEAAYDQALNDPKLATELYAERMNGGAQATA